MRTTGKARHSTMARPFFALLALLAAPAAHAYTPPDLWRIVDVLPRPWNPTPPTDAARALFGSGLAILEDGTVKGPAPLACAQAHMRDLVVPTAELFANQVPEARIDEMFRTLKLDSSGVAIRITCGEARFDYQFAQEGRILLFDNAILILRKPMDEIEAKELDEWVKPFRPGFDCKDAKSTAERLACADFRLSRADRLMTEGYAAMRATYSEASFATIRDTQRRWLAFTRARCGANAPMPTEWTERRDITACLQEATETQAGLLGARPFTAGKLRLEMRMNGFFRTSPPGEDIIVWPWLSGALVSDALNRFIAERLQPQSPNPAMAPSKLGGYDRLSSSQRSYGVTLFTERLLGVTFSTVLYTGGAHEGHATTAILFDLKSGRALTANDVFRADRNWRKAITALCLERLREDGPDDTVTEAAVAKVVGNISAWQFGPKSATVFFDFYTIRPYAAGPADVEIPYANLREYLRPDFPLP